MPNLSLLAVKTQAILDLEMLVTLPKPLKEDNVPDSFFNLAYEIINRDELLLIINDIDLTISSGGRNGDTDPRITSLHPQSAAALSKLSKKGHIIGFISDRSGVQIAQIAQDAMIENPMILGISGFELYKEELNDDQEKSFIDERFLPYKDKITLVLKSLKDHIYAKAKNKINDQDETFTSILLNEGELILENKGISKLYPHGLALRFNFNFIPPHLRTSIINNLKYDYEKIIKQMFAQNHLEALSFLHVWGMTKDDTTAEKNDRYSLGFEPLILVGKSYGMHKLLKEVKFSLHREKKIGMVIFAGDSNADVPAMLTQKEIVKALNLKNNEEVYSYNIWVKPPLEQHAARINSDMTVYGPDGYADILKELSLLAENKSR